MSRCRRVRCVAARRLSDRLAAALAVSILCERDGWAAWAELACELYPPPASFTPLALWRPHAVR